MAKIINTFQSTASLANSLSHFSSSSALMIPSLSWNGTLNNTKTQLIATNNNGDTLTYKGNFKFFPYTVNSISFKGSDSSSGEFITSLAISQTGHVTGFLGNFVYSNSDSTSYEKFIGKFYPSGEKTSTLSFLEYRDNGYSVSMSGSFAFDSSLKFSTAKLDSFSYSDGTHSISATGLASVDIRSLLNNETHLSDNDMKTFLSSADALTGGTGDDYLAGYAGNDTIVGLQGNDTLVGGAGNDTLTGGSGIDTFFVDIGVDTINDLGLGGADILTVTIGSTANVTLGAAWTATSDTVNRGTTTIKTAGLAVDLSAVSTGNGFSITNSGAVTSLIGSNLADSITGGAGNETIIGGLGNDSLIGGLGNDSLNGGLGNDTIKGGLGNDLLRGEGGIDCFVLDSAIGSSNIDTLFDFTSGTDVIQLSKSIFNKIGSTGTLNANAFYAYSGAVAGHDADDRIIYNTSTGVLYYDADGSGKGAAVQIAIVGASSHPTITSSDFQVIG